MNGNAWKEVLTIYSKEPDQKISVSMISVIRLHRGARGNLNVLAICKLLKVLVARDGIEPPTPAFSGPPTELRKWLKSTDLIDYNELTSLAL